MKSKKLLKPIHRDITGNRIGLLTVLRPTLRKEQGSTVWKCRCDCGQAIRVSYKDLSQRIVSDCGKNCVPLQRLKKQVKTVKMWDDIKTERRKKKYEENLVRWEMEKLARQRRRQREEREIEEAAKPFDNDYGF